MLADDYVGSLVVKGQLINVGVDDYGQCYYFEYYNKEEGKIMENGCGTYNDQFIDEIVAFFDTKGYHISVWGKEDWDEDTKNLTNRWIDKGWADEDPEGFKEMLANRNREDYEIYDLEKMYKEFEERAKGN